MFNSMDFLTAGNDPLMVGHRSHLAQAIVLAPLVRFPTLTLVLLSFSDPLSRFTSTPIPATSATLPLLPAQPRESALQLRSFQSRRRSS